MIRLGVIGCGARISGVINHAIKPLAPDVRVVGIVDPDEAGARSRLAEEDRADVKFFDSVEALARDGKVDALAIGTRCHQHAPYAVEAAKTGLPLFLEKAGGPSTWRRRKRWKRLSSRRVARWW